MVLDEAVDGNSESNQAPWADEPKACRIAAMLHWLGIKPSYSRPRVSKDNAFAESAFRTAKYRPEFARHGFKDLDQARRWANAFVHWYNVEHLRSAIRFVSPSQRHAGQDRELLTARLSPKQRRLDVLRIS